jgi:hypothetical protein
MNITTHASKILLFVTVCFMILFLIVNFLELAK